MKPTKAERYLEVTLGAGGAAAVTAVAERVALDQTPNKWLPGSKATESDTTTFDVSPLISSHAIIVPADILAPGCKEIEGA